MCARDVATASARLLSAIVVVADRAKPGFDADEVAFALAWTQSAARSQVDFGRYLIGTVPAVFDALARGDIDVRRAWVFADVLALVDDAIAVDIARAVLPHAPRLTTSQLRDRLRRAVLKADPDAGKRTARSEDDRYVACQPDREGTASLYGVRLPAARATAAFERVDAYARGRKRDGDDRTLDQLRADTFLDLLTGVHVATPPVHRTGVIELTVPWTTATGATNDPGLLAGYGPIDADTARVIIVDQLLHVTRCDVENGNVSWRHAMTSSDGTLLSTTTIKAPIPRPPVEADPRRRSPGPALTRWIVTRDRTCRAPGCCVPARAADIDHTIDHADGGPTSHDNLAVVCRHHHRLKHEGGWQVTQPEPGTLTWISPAGGVYRRGPDHC
jgi:hypothetical protein